jgi:hypothetical protein
MTSAVDDPHYWYARAEESRVLAEQMVDPEARRMMFGIAKSYDLIAQRTGERLRGEFVSQQSLSKL